MTRDWLDKLKAAHLNAGGLGPRDENWQRLAYEAFSDLLYCAEMEVRWQEGEPSMRSLWRDAEQSKRAQAAMLKWAVERIKA